MHVDIIIIENIDLLPSVALLVVACVQRSLIRIAKDEKCKVSVLSRGLIIVT
jgi:hypothetical protein